MPEHKQNNNSNRDQNAGQQKGPDHQEQAASGKGGERLPERKEGQKQVAE